MHPDRFAFLPPRRHGVASRHGLAANAPEGVGSFVRRLAMKRIGLAAFLFAALSGAAQAQNGAPDAENGRYTFNRVDDGYLRLDTRTGQVSICSRRAAGW